jgi:hypothetical protein
MELNFIFFLASIVLILRLWISTVIDFTVLSIINFLVDISSNSGRVLRTLSYYLATAVLSRIIGMQVEWKMLFE